MFESFQDRPTPKRRALIPVALVLAGLTIALLAYSLRGNSRYEPPEKVGLTPAVPFPSPGALAPLARVELPGMSIEAPGDAKVTGDYVTGSAQATSPIEWTVTWQHGPLPPAEPLRRIADTMARSLEAQQMSPTRVTSSRELTVGGLPGHQFELTSGLGVTLVATFVECGGRVVQIFGGGQAIAKTITTRMVESFRCTPEAAKDVDREAVAVELRPGWQRTAPTGLPMLVNAREILVRPSLQTGAAGVPIESFVPMAVRSSGFTIDADKPQERAGRKLWLGSVDVGGKRRPAAIVAWQCADDPRVAVIYVASMEGAPLDDGIALALTGRCLSADEKPPAYPVRAARKR